MRTHQIKAYFFVSVQFAMLIFLMGSGPWLARSPHGFLVEMAGLFLGLLAIYQMQPGNFNVAPLPKQGGKLVTTGVYQYLRHPMYLAQLLVFVPLIAEHYTIYRLMAWLILLFNLILKLGFEEKNLIRQFEGYAAYREKSWRLIPFVW